MFGEAYLKLELVNWDEEYVFALLLKFDNDEQAMQYVSDMYDFVNINEFDISSLGGSASELVDTYGLDTVVDYFFWWEVIASYVRSREHGRAQPGAYSTSPVPGC